MDSYDFSDESEPDTTTFGYRIANLVADQLQSGKILGYAHRDYCGMGMKVNEDQQFLYGELYDGEFHVPTLFETRDLFITWLSAQSTESLARLDADEFYQKNQVITRKRLLEFIGCSN
ncbi:hypothetical protein HHL23_01890 [Chryseobacterium sp. RP-3-3]|uniref:Uncharacterized protein n=1 Tax=Chryseobacterium antibioticum TaxID=2728847 RepID=A0A7Y0AJV6_9FLAO|nr:hypothetical protein [Chryseobacterium antibioticum]NML68552.1 hypothetical protein [Chryseobacterium antibioticum]